MKSDSYTRRLGVNSLSLQRIVKSSHSGEPLFCACRNPGPPQSPFPESIQVPHPQAHGLRIANARSGPSPACPGRRHLLILSLRYHSPLLFSFSPQTYPYCPHPSSDLCLFLDLRKTHQLSSCLRHTWST